MISLRNHFILLVGVVVICRVSVGESSSRGRKTGILTNLCDDMVLSTETMSSSLETAFGVGNVSCEVQEKCRRLECVSSNMTKDGQAGLVFAVDVNMCQSDKAIYFRAGGRSLRSDNWELTIPLISRKIGRYKITLLNEGSQKQLFLKVWVHSKIREKGLILNSLLQSCETESEGSCSSLPLFNLPYLHINACDDSNKTNKYLSRNRSSRSVENAAEMHQLKSKNVSITTSPIGGPCNNFSILTCGSGGACVNKGGGRGVCECNDYYSLAPNGTCIINRTIDPVNPTPTNENYSVVLEMLFSLFLLLSLATAVYFCVKYQVFQRIRNRLPLSLRCWPFPMLRRTTAPDDNVSLAYPIDEDGDDEPLLL